MATTVADLETQLATAYATKKKILDGVQEYNDRGKKVVYPSLSEIRKEIEYLENRIAKLSRGRIVQADVSMATEM